MVNPLRGLTPDVGWKQYEDAYFQMTLSWPLRHGHVIYPMWGDVQWMCVWHTSSARALFDRFVTLGNEWPERFVVSRGTCHHEVPCECGANQLFLHLFVHAPVHIFSIFDRLVLHFNPHNFPFVYPSLYTHTNFSYLYASIYIGISPLTFSTYLCIYSFSICTHKLPPQKLSN